MVSVKGEIGGVAFRAEFGTAHIAQLDQGTIGRAFQYDGFEFLRISQTSDRTHTDLKLLPIGSRRLTHFARRHLDILFLQRRDDV